MYTAFREKTYFVLAHERKKVGGSLKVPLKLHSSVDDPLGDGDGTPTVHQEIGIEKGDVFDLVTRNQVTEFAHHPIDCVSIEAALIEDHVGAVVALVGTP